MDTLYDIDLLSFNNEDTSIANFYNSNEENGPGDETIKGTEKDDLIDGFGGDDTISGLGGDDILIGGDGNDVIDGGSGTNRLYADAGDDERGMMILDRENNKEPEYINWLECPKYRTYGLRQLLENTEKLIKPKMYLRVTIDVPISYEEASFIKETFVNDYDCREITLIPSQQDEEIHTAIDISTFESVDQIVTKEITAIDTENYDKTHASA